MKQIIRLTESDLHRIVKESVNRVLKESNDNDVEAAKQRLIAARKKGNRDEILAASQAWQKAKEAAGTANVIKPKAGWSEEENKKRGNVGKAPKFHKWRRKDDIGVGRQINKDDNKKLQINDIDDILGV